MRASAIIFSITLLTIILTIMVNNTETLAGTMQCFSANYSEARQKFLDAAHATGAAVEHYQNPHAGSHSEKLYTDVALLGPKDASTIVVLSSGTHGVEGFTGSAIQTCLLKKGLGRLPPDKALLFIHAINPYGFAYLRRSTEDNVDLNRNFTDHSKPYPDNSGYDELADAINPGSISIWSNTKSVIKLFWYAMTKGRAELKRAISAGQYTHPHGLFYGGRQETWSNKILRQIAHQYLRSAERVVIIDIHTGLGPFGDAEVIMNETLLSPAYKRAVSWWGEMVRTTVNGGSVSTHLGASLKLVWPDMLPDAEVTAVSLEFGTLSAVKVFWALRKENWLHHHGGTDHPDAEEIKIALLQAFYPDNDSWKAKVLSQGRLVVERVLPRNNSCRVKP